MDYIWTVVMLVLMGTERGFRELDLGVYGGGRLSNGSSFARNNIHALILRSSTATSTLHCIASHTVPFHLIPE